MCEYVLLMFGNKMLVCFRNGCFLPCVEVCRLFAIRFGLGLLRFCSLFDYPLPDI
jgi:hypothetical protein